MVTGVYGIVITETCAWQVPIGFDMTSSIVWILLYTDWPHVCIYTTRNMDAITLTHLTMLWLSLILFRHTSASTGNVDGQHHVTMLI